MKLLLLVAWSGIGIFAHAFSYLMRNTFQNNFDRSWIVKSTDSDCLFAAKVARVISIIALIMVLALIFFRPFKNPPLRFPTIASFTVYDTECPNCGIQWLGHRSTVGLDECHYCIYHDRGHHKVIVTARSVEVGRLSK